MWTLVAAAILGLALGGFSLVGGIAVVLAPLGAGLVALVTWAIRELRF
jgi:hypothetical protein